MGTIQLPSDFNEFLKLLNSSGAEYLLIGGYAVNYYGYSRSTGDMDVWVGCTEENAARVASALRAFGFASADPQMFSKPGQVIRMGFPPLRLEILTTVSGVEFAECYERRESVALDDVPVPVIRLEDLKTNKKASGRSKDLADLEGLG